MEYRFVDFTDKAESFFSKLPEDWQQGIAPYWAEYKHTARIYVLESGSEILGGGIVFSTVSPDTQEVYQQEALRWFRDGYLYIGFLWFSEQHRGKQLGTKWLQHLYATHAQRNFWLAIDQFSLSSFYIRNGFELVEKIETAEGEEWVLRMNCTQEKNKNISLYQSKELVSVM